MQVAPAIPSSAGPSADHAAQARPEEACSRRSFVRWSCVGALAFALNFRVELYQAAMGVVLFADSLAQVFVQLILLAVFVAAFLRFFLSLFLVYLHVLLMTIATFVFIILVLFSGNTKPLAQTQTATAPAVTRAEPSDTDWTKRPTWSRARSGSPQ